MTNLPCISFLTDTVGEEKSSIPLSLLRQSNIPSPAYSARTPQRVNRDLRAASLKSPIKVDLGIAMRLRDAKLA